MPDPDPSQPIIDFLHTEGAGGLPHGGGRTLADHLLGTHHIVRRWGQPTWLADAALIHSVYGTEAYRAQLLSPSRRREVAAVAGEQAERIAYLFCTTPRRALLAGTHRWARGLPARSLGGPTAASDHPATVDPSATREELDALVLLHMANIAEQAHAADGSPGRWLARVRELGELIADSDSVSAPRFIAQLSGFSEADETLARQAYGRAVIADGEDRANGFALAAAVCPVVAEPCAWCAFLLAGRGEVEAARSWATQARRRLAELGTAWDRRLEFEEWDALIAALARSPDRASADSGGAITDPRALLQAVVPVAGAIPRASRPTIVALEADAGRRRFQRYLDSLADGDGLASGAIYPDLESRPWYDAQEFGLARYLEENYAPVREEILALDAVRFSRESEPIRRTGHWDVAFLYERGRRHDDVCAACPVTVRGIETYPTVRTLAGLTYVSRMRPATHIAPHRGPTNLRLRCHLAISVPDGDCAIRVGGQTRRWREGECLVFDDYFVHEAWNHTDEDRIVLIVDLWHPGLSATEVALLEALQGYAGFHARRLNRYWSANAAARREAAETGPPTGRRRWPGRRPRQGP